MRKLLRRLAGVAALALVAYGLLLRYPQPLFAYHVSEGALELYSDEPFDETAAREVLRKASAKISASPIYRGQSAAAFVSNATWRRKLLFNKSDGAGGVAYPPFTSNVFLRQARVNENRLIGPSGSVVAGVRTLDYYIAHEVAHVLTGDYLGAWRYYRLPQWAREGYADYTAKGGAFDYDEARRGFLDDTRELDWRRSGLYMRFHLLFAHLVDRRGWSVERALGEAPAQEVVEAWVRE